METKEWFWRKEHRVCADRQTCLKGCHVCAGRRGGFGLTLSAYFMVSSTGRFTELVIPSPPRTSIWVFSILGNRMKLWLRK